MSPWTVPPFALDLERNAPLPALASGQVDHGPLQFLNSALALSGVARERFGLRFSERVFGSPAQFRRNVAAKEFLFRGSIGRVNGRRLFGAGRRWARPWRSPSGCLWVALCCGRGGGFRLVVLNHLIERATVDGLQSLGQS